MNNPAFDFNVTFSGNRDNNTLTPLGVPDFRELQSGSTNNKDAVAFKIGIQHANVDKLVATITAASRTLYREELAANLRTVGQHDWSWDGFGNNGLLDSRLLKDPGLTLELVATLGGQTKTKVLKFKNRHAEEDWVEVVIDKTTRVVTIELRINAKDGGGIGVGEAPPAEVQSSSMYGNIPATDVRKQRHVRTRSFIALADLLKQGMKRYWSRQVSVGGTAYTVDVNPILATSKAMDDIDLTYNTNRDWVRSSNPGSVRGFYSLFGNFVPERIAYNVGWIKYSSWVYVRPSVADQEFQKVAAHEIGHEILSAYGGESYSYGHRGSSTVVTQRPKPLSDGGVSYPASGDVDLMTYYHGNAPANLSTRLYASEQDVRSLLWLARVLFDA